MCVFFVVVVVVVVFFFHPSSFRSDYFPSGDIVFYLMAEITDKETKYINYGFELIQIKKDDVSNK